ncbi:unnamed protein product [Ectocarpus sp. 12 AP-2014]
MGCRFLNSLSTPIVQSVFCFYYSCSRPTLFGCPVRNNARGTTTKQQPQESANVAHTRDLCQSSRRWAQGKRACPSRRLSQATASDTGKKRFAGPFFCRAPIDRSRSAKLPDARPDGRS